MKGFIRVITTDLHDVLISVDSIESVVSAGRYNDHVTIRLKSMATHTVNDKYSEVIKHIEEAQK